MRHVLAIDSSGLNVLEDIVKRTKKEKVALLLSGVHMQPVMAMTKAGIMDLLGEDNCHVHIDPALNHARRLLGLPEEETPGSHVPSVTRDFP